MPLLLNLALIAITCEGDQGGLTRLLTGSKVWFFTTMLCDEHWIDHANSSHPDCLLHHTAACQPHPEFASGPHSGSSDAIYELILSELPRFRNHGLACLEICCFQVWGARWEPGFDDWEPEQLLGGNPAHTLSFEPEGAVADAPLVCPKTVRDPSQRARRGLRVLTASLFPQGPETGWKAE